MRSTLVLAICGLCLGAALPALAQSNTVLTYNNGTPYQSPYNQVYVTPSGQQMYYATDGAATPVYNNNNPQPLPMEQLIAGKNAPSYSYGSTQPYSFNNGSTSYGSLTPQQVDMINSRTQNNVPYTVPMQQQTAMAQLGQYGTMYQQQQQQQVQYGQTNDTTSLNSILNPQPEQPVRRRQVYKKAPDPLAAPPRLFNPDQ